MKLHTLMSLLLVAAAGCVDLADEPAVDDDALTELGQSQPISRDGGLRIVATAPRAGDVLSPCGETFMLLRFSDRVLTPSSFVALTDAEGRALDAKVELITDEEPWIVKVTPGAPLAMKREYVVQVRGGEDGLRSIHGEVLADDFDLWFETGDRTTGFGSAASLCSND